jgi:hypothetical protein
MPYIFLNNISNFNLLMKKKVIDVVIKISDIAQLNNYLAPTYNKIVGK